MSRREFINLCALSTVGFAAGCATNPVTGESQFMLVSEAEEIKMDSLYSPQQLSSDFGVVQDKQLSQYLQSIGKQMSAQTHRPQMPYRFLPVNATYVNAYAFPGGTIAWTRGILLNLDNEAELAALIGHELGHVNARHTAEIMSNHKVSSAELLFATHPMSSERYQTAVKTASNKYKAAKSNPLHRERYMDNTVGLRKVKTPFFSCCRVPR